MSFREEFLAAAQAFVDQVERLPDGAWDGPALGDWTLRELVGHTSSAMTSVVNAVSRRPPELALDHASGYYALRRTVDPSVYEAAVAAAAAGLVAETAALGTDPVSTVHEQFAAARGALDAVADDEVVVATAAGGMPLREWLPTRTFELAVHCLDIQAAAGVPADLPVDVQNAGLTLAATTAVEVGDGPTVLRALTGRGPLPDGYSAL